MRRAFTFLGTIALFAAVLVTIDRLASPAGDQVVVLGDSITALGVPRLNRANDHKFRLDIEATFGHRFSDKLPDALALAATKPDQVIIALGTNDALQHTPVSVTRSALIRMIAMFPDADCIHLVTVNPGVNQAGNTPRSEAQAINRMMRQAAENRSNVDVIEFGAIAAESMRKDPPLGFTSDGVHPADAGLARLADEEIAALERCGRPWRVW